MRFVLGLFALVASLAAAAPAPQPVEARVALVIGNSTYKNSPLLNPVNDAKAVAGALRDAGFEVIELHDQGAVEMRRAIREFGERLRGKGAGLFYFAGHGVQVRGRNFLVPVNADIAYEDEIEDQSVDVNLVLGKMENAKARVNIVILDACRNNPFARSQRGGQNGLAAIEAPIGTLIAFATSPGQVASDGAGRNGLYTEHLVRAIGETGLKVEDVFKRVRASVRSASEGRQVPWENTSLEGDFYFRHAAPVDTAANEAERLRRQEAAIQSAVADALSRSKEEAEREKKTLERFYAQKLETERESMRKETLDRIAAMEAAAKVAASRPVQPIDTSAPPLPAMVVASAPAAVQVQRPPSIDATRPMAAPTAAAAAKSTAPTKPVEASAQVTEPSKSEESTALVEEPAPAEALAEEGKPNEMPASFLLALGVDPSRRNKVASVADEVARGLKPAQRAVGDTWTYYRELRDGPNVTRRNYLTLTVTSADRSGSTVSFSDSADVGRYDAEGNPFSLPNGREPASVFDPVAAFYRYPLVPGSTFDSTYRESKGSLRTDDSGRITVVGWEQVTVPAGTFNALKITKVGYRSWSSFPGQIQQSKRVTNVWYVPALRGLARFERLEVSSQGVVMSDTAWELDFFELN